MPRKIWTARRSNRRVADHRRVVRVSRDVFDELPELIPGRPDYRILISGGVLVHVIAVAGQLVPDGTIEILKVRIDQRTE